VELYLEECWCYYCCCHHHHFYYYSSHSILTQLLHTKSRNTREKKMASEEGSSSSSHSSGLGVMPSMSPQCTPLKHRYDACFNRWFEEYLGLPASSPSNSSGSVSATSTSDGHRDSGVSGFFSKVSGSSESSSNDRKRLRERLEGDCGPFWKEYQTCVLVSLSEQSSVSVIRERP
jgi:TRIAP1/MDM35 family protein